MYNFEDIYYTEFFFFDSSLASCGTGLDLLLMRKLPKDQNFITESSALRAVTRNSYVTP